MSVEQSTISDVEQNKRIARRIFEEVFNTGAIGVMDEIGASNVVFHTPTEPQPVVGVRGIQDFVLRFRRGFPDVVFTIEDVIGENDKVVIRWSTVQTHSGEYLGIPPTNKTARGTGMDVFRLKDGKIEEIWLMLDALGVMQQLGVIPDPNKIPRPVLRLLSFLQGLGSK